MDRLTGVELHRVAHSIGQRDRIGGLIRKIVVKEVVEGSGAFHHGVELADEPSGIDRRWTHEAVTGRQGLPVDREHAMALEVPERAVIGQNIKAIVGALECTPGTLASVGSGADVRLDHLNAFLDGHVAHTSFDRPLGQRRVRIEHGGDHLDFAVRVEIDQVDNVVGHRSADLIAEDLLAQGLHRGPSVIQVRRRANPTLREVDALQERRHDLAEFGEHEIGVGASLGQRVGPHAQKQCLIRLPGAVDADVRQRGGGKHAADCVESPGLDR